MPDLSFSLEHCIMERVNTFIVSNRLPITVKRGADGCVELTKSAGGLVSGLNDVHADAGAVWVGHSGLFIGDEDYASTREILVEKRYAPVPLTEEDYRDYYNGAANGAIWPVFHYFLGRARFDQTHWAAYEKVNRQFADTVLSMAKPGDRVWVHDYQLMLVPAMLRDALSDLQIAYFHHIPFPATDLFRVLPWRIELLRGLLGADLIGMHNLEYVMHFQSAVSRLLGVEVEKDQVHHGGRVTRVGAFPLGVDVASIRAAASESSEETRVAELAQAATGKTVFLGIDRLDYTKGIPERMRAFAALLKAHPELVGEVMLVQVCVPSRQDVPSYVELRAEVERLVGQINGEFGRPGYVPLHYLHQPFSPEEVQQFYKLGSVALVTPLRDGLNLVAKEYVASRNDDDGVLVLSEFAGAAAEMGEALLVNPFDESGLARAMYDAYSMPAEERRRRMHVLRSRVMQADNLAWSRAFMRAWAVASKKRARPASVRLEDAALEAMLDKLSATGRPQLFLDYDGTLVPIRRRPDLALPSASTRRILHALASCPDVEVALVTGRTRAFCDEYFGDLRISLAAEHGSYFRTKGSAEWESVTEPREFAKIRGDVLRHFADYVARIPGAAVEEKESALVLHYREAHPEFAPEQAYALRDSLIHILANTPFSAFQAKCAIEVKSISASKGRAVERFLRLWDRNADFLTAGDDTTDEDMFLVEPERNHSIYVGEAHGFARYHVSSTEDFEDVLRALIVRLAGDAATKRHATSRSNGERLRGAPQK